MNQRETTSAVRNGILQAVVILAVISGAIGWYAWKQAEARKRNEDAREYQKALEDANRALDERDRQRAAERSFESPSPAP